MYEIPTSVLIEDKSYAIRNQGDFRMVLDCFAALEDTSLDPNERIVACLIIFYEDFNEVEDVARTPRETLEQLTLEMFKFMNCGKSKEELGAKQPFRLLDWEKDSQLVCSAVNKVAGMEIRSCPYLHWWTFMGYYLAIGESALATVVSIRSKIAKNKKLEKFEKEFRRDNPQYFNMDYRTQQDREEDELIKQLWNSGK